MIKIISLEFRKVVNNIRLKFKEETIDRKGIFLPFSFTTLLNFLSQKANRTNLSDAIEKNVNRYNSMFMIDLLGA